MIILDFIYNFNIITSLKYSNIHYNYCNTKEFNGVIRISKTFKYT